jgi:hypothetical protein
MAAESLNGKSIEHHDAIRSKVLRSNQDLNETIVTRGKLGINKENLEMA